ncbi:MAG: right-handed parallel beta-helix repeat-containing protein [bacterium]|nr:MAG: right-handed parallel beta-helix repeat-containing protein [bacterium]
MKGNTFYYIALLMLSTACILATGCEEEITFKNAPPGNITITKNKCFLATGSVLMLEGNAVDDDGDEVFYSWQAEDGTFTPQSGEGKEVAWTAPATPGTVRITLKVTDRIDERTKSIDVEVGEKFPPFIAGHVTLTDNGYPYVLTSAGRQLISSTSSLEIESGVRIIIDSGSGGLLVRGDIIVKGTADRNVSFEPNACPGEEKIWGGIVLLGRDADGTFEHAQVFSADSCIQAVDGANCILEDCWVRDNPTLGIGIFGNSVVEITNCHIEYNGTGLDVRNSNATVRTSSISYNTKDGVYLEDTLGVKVALFEGCTVTNNNWNAFLVSDFYSPIITQCSIFSNGQYAIRLTFYPRGDTLKAENNFWGLAYQDSASIAGVIYDAKDSPQTINAVVDFQPWLPDDPNLVRDGGFGRSRKTIWERLLR